MFDFLKRENESQEKRLLKHLTKHEGREVTLTSIVIGLKIFHHAEIIRRLRAIGRKEWFTIENRMDRTKDRFGNFRSFYMLIKD